ncbi:MAG: hypothetical protein AAFP04_13645 [Myxococcota bacterium]
MRRARQIALLAFYIGALGLSTAQAQDLNGERRSLTFIGFQQYSDASRVFIRTNEAVKFRVDDSKQDAILVTLENTSPDVVNHLNHLDTRYFNSPVTFIQPRLIEGASPSIEIEIRLRNRVPYETLQNDNFVAIDFQRR